MIAFIQRMFSHKMVRHTKREQLQKLLKNHGLSVVYIKDTSITLNCFGIVPSTTRDRVNLTDSKGNVLEANIKEADINKFIKQYEDAAKKQYPDLPKEQALAKYVDELVEISFFKTVGIDRKGILLLKQGENIIFEFNSFTNGYVSGVMKKTDNVLLSYIFYIRDKSSNASRSFLEFRSKSTQVAKILRVEKIEYGGISILNDDVLELVIKQGFEKRTVEVPKLLGGLPGETTDIYIKTFKIK